MSNIKAADLQETIRRLGTSMSAGAGAAGNKMSDYWNNLNPDLKKTILSGLAGAAVGGGITGGIASLTPRDPEESKSKAVINTALLGALLGGTAGAGLPTAKKILGGEIKLPGEEGKSWTSSFADTAMGPVVHNPLASAGLAAGTGGAIRYTLPHLQSAIEEASNPLINRITPRPTLFQPGGLKDLGTRAVQGAKEMPGHFRRGADKLQEAINALQMDIDNTIRYSTAAASGGAVPQGFKPVEIPKALDSIKKLRAAKLLYKLGPLGIPLGLGLGWTLDRYLKGKA